MNNMLPRPLFWVEAANQSKSRRTAFGELLIYYLLFFLAILAQSLLIAIPASVWLVQTQSDELMKVFEAGELSQDMILNFVQRMPDWMNVLSMFAGVTIGLVPVFYCWKFQKRTLSSMGLCGKRRVGECVLGLAVGAVLAAAVIGLGVAAGGYRLFYTQPSRNTWIHLLLALLGCVVAGSSLELLTRGFFAPALGAGRSVPFALFFSTLVSGLIQNGNSLFSLDMANELLLGLLLGVLVLKRGSLWAACGLHAAWLFTQNYVFDVAPADAHSRLRLFAADADIFRPLLSGGEYGPMHSICATVVLLAALTVVLSLKAKHVAQRQASASSDHQQTNFL